MDFDVHYLCWKSTHKMSANSFQFWTVAKLSPPGAQFNLSLNFHPYKFHPQSDNFPKKEHRDRLQPLNKSGRRQTDTLHRRASESKQASDLIILLHTFQPILSIHLASKSSKIFIHLESVHFGRLVRPIGNDIREKKSQNLNTCWPIESS